MRLTRALINRVGGGALTAFKALLRLFNSTFKALLRLFNRVGGGALTQTRT